MKNNILSIFVLAFSFNVYAHTFTIELPCQKSNLTFDFDPTKFETVGDLTTYIMSKNHIPYIGNEDGLNSVFNTPLGMDALEVTSDEEMFAYGWCYKVNKKINQDYASKFYVNEEVKNVTWFYGTSRFYKDAWVDMCVPAYFRKNGEVCQKLLNK